ncbi:LuxR C-terminal-related transcriptional regulator [Kitasatospora sp. NPDC089913]|uniref:helix-turn-helix transcriptional regulator n=1 Tax=Streptomycetaceae TaxID=2062 RepID=UPI00087B66D0|nr:helix-turn-helix transcriptional regulator [Streptomyces sp. TLI_053]SDS88783.1 transcriptional regulator, LuxR family [Streptomyces sp. TLI_053]
MTSFRARERRMMGEIDDLAAAKLPLEQFFRQLLTVLGPALGSEAGCLHGADPVTGFLTSTVAEGLQPTAFEHAIRLEMWSDDTTRFVDIRAAGRVVETVHRATGGRPERSVRYRELLSEYGLGDELRMNFDVGGGRWGAAALMRAAGSAPFGASEQRLAERAARAVAVALRDYALPAAGTPDGQDGRADPQDGPYWLAVAVIGPTGQLTSADAGARQLFEELAEGQYRPAGVPTALVYLSERARTHAASAAHAWTRLRRPNGQWVAVHASLLDQGPRGSVALVAQPASPVDVIPLSLLAHRFSPREQEVVLQAVRGLSTRDIARRLFLSPATVQDHLKSAFTKTGVRSRRELVALLAAPYTAGLGRPPV